MRLYLRRGQPQRAVSPGTRLWDEMKAADRLALDRFPEDWRYYTLTFPVARYRQLSQGDIIREMLGCNRRFYSIPRILGRIGNSSWNRRRPFISLVGNFSYRGNIGVDRKSYADFQRQWATRVGA